MRSLTFPWNVWETEREDEGRSRRDVPWIHDVQSSDPSHNNVNHIKALACYHKTRWSLGKLP